jgi:predicted RNA-binding Zn ribbon-like protein
LYVGYGHQSNENGGILKSVADHPARDPAPGSLRLVQEFVNTRDVESGDDRLAGPEGLATWLHEQALPGAAGPFGRADVTRARQLREALRALLRANSGGAPDPAAAAVVNSASERAPLRLSVDEDGEAHLEGAADGRAGIDPALARILAAAYTGMAEGAWGRLKVCADKDCEWSFYDRSRNHSGQWCDMAVCGGRHKVRAYRARRAPGHTPS